MKEKYISIFPHFFLTFAYYQKLFAAIHLKKIYIKRLHIHSKYKNMSIFLRFFVFCMNILFKRTWQNIRKRLNSYFWIQHFFILENDDYIFECVRVCVYICACVCVCMCVCVYVCVCLSV